MINVILNYMTLAQIQTEIFLGAMIEIIEY